MFIPVGTPKRTYEERHRTTEYLKSIPVNTYMKGLPTMNFSTAAFLFDDNVKAVKVSYEKGDIGTIFKTMDKDLKVDDLVVISTGTRYNYTIGKVIEVDPEIDFNTTSQIGWVVSRVDIAAHETLKANEQAAIKQVRDLEIAQKKQQLRSAMSFGQEAAVSFNLLAAPSKDAAA